jgi:hypothetical protein
MSLAQVVYNISTDAECAAQWSEDPEAALAGKGFQLSREELNFLKSGLKESVQNDGQRVRLSDIVLTASSWR